LYVAERPKPVSGEYWERPLAANAEQREAAVRNAQTIFAPDASGLQCAAVSGYVLLSFGTWPIVLKNSMFYSRFFSRYEATANCDWSCG